MAAGCGNLLPGVRLPDAPRRARGSAAELQWALLGSRQPSPSTKSAFLCAFAIQNPRFQPFRAQNRGFCVRMGIFPHVFALSEHKKVLRQISCCQVKQVWKILIQRSRSEARPYILLFIYFILLFRPSVSPLLIEYFMAFLMGAMSRWTLFTKLTTSP